MDAEGEVVAQPQDRSVEALQAVADEVGPYLELRGVEDPTDAQRVELFLAELGLGTLDYAEAEERAGALPELSAEQQAEVDQGLVDLEIVHVLEQEQPRTKAARAELGGRFAAMLEEGKAPSGGRAAEVFYVLLLDHAEAEGDAGLFETGLDALREAFAAHMENPRVQQFFQQQEQRLEQLR